MPDGRRGDAQRAGPSVWGFPVPRRAGWTAAEMVDRAARRRRRRVLDGRRQLPRDAARRGRARARRSRGRACASTRTSCCRRRCSSDGDGDVLILPAATRYESPGGGTRDVHRAPDHLLARDSRPPDRLGAAGMVGVPRGDGARRSRARRHLVGLTDAAAIRREIARGDSALRGHRDAVARRAIRCSGAAGACTPTGASPRRTDARTSRPCRSRREPRAPSQSRSVVSTRRGKQFNSMVQRDDRSADRRRPRQTCS